MLGWLFNPSDAKACTGGATSVALVIFGKNWFDVDANGDSEGTFATGMLGVGVKIGVDVGGMVGKTPVNVDVDCDGVGRGTGKGVGFSQGLFEVLV